MSQTPNAAERLLAHAKLCREIARMSRSEEIAREFERLADECARAAHDAGPAPKPS